MTRCHFCDHRNPPGQKNCEKCGAELAHPEPPAETEASLAARHDLSDRERETLKILAVEGKIAAIKHYRETTGLGLKESKDAVEELARRVGVKPAAGTGCATVLVAVFATACLLAVKFAAGAEVSARAVESPVSVTTSVLQDEAPRRP
jgi:ribosomal protein L7/L12